MRIAGLSRENVLFWFFFISFASVAGALLFLAKPLFLSKTGIRASLVAEAKKWRGIPQEDISKNIGRRIKKYLDASKHTSRALVHVSEATPERLAIEIRLPWSEVSAKKRRQRAGLVCRLGADMLENAGAKDTIFLVHLQRMTKDSKASEPVGTMVYSLKDKKCIWRESFSEKFSYAKHLPMKMDDI